jgi:hypothetical protein
MASLSCGPDAEQKNTGTARDWQGLFYVAMGIHHPKPIFSFALARPVWPD